MRRSFLAAAVIPVVAFAAVTFGSSKDAAASGTTLDLDLDLGSAFNRCGRSVCTTSLDFSAGGGARLGYRFVIPRSYLYVQPEGGIHYMRFGFNSANLGGYDYGVTVNGGLKFGLTGVVQPNVFAHLGLGAMGFATSANTTELDVGPAMDIGAGIDFRVVPGFSLGAQLAYNSAVIPGALSTQTAAKWMTFGLTAGFHWGDAPERRVVYVRRGYGY